MLTAAPVYTDVSPWWRKWNPDEVRLTDDSVDAAWKSCVLQDVYFGHHEFSGGLNGRISAIFVIFITSAVVTLFPVLAQGSKWIAVPESLYVIAKNFGSGVIVATAFVHLMDPAYGAIGPRSCVGQTGGWGVYSWCSAIMLASSMLVFLIDVYSDLLARSFYGESRYSSRNLAGEFTGCESDKLGTENWKTEENSADCRLEIRKISDRAAVRDFNSQFGGFLILEFGVLFHSVMIGLTLGSSDDYVDFYIVLVFHQAFEGLGIGARLSMIPFPRSKYWLKYLLCLAYALVTPIGVVIGLGVRYAYREKAYGAQVVSGVLDAISSGILLYTGLVELLARDFVFNADKLQSFGDLTLQLIFVALGAGLMALLGKWA